ncbi:MAG: hypothetical protein CL681_01945, partial [Blastopirellula sp.]|nr:hypothetical protein [Blastopirellula sp.]
MSNPARFRRRKSASGKQQHKRRTRRRLFVESLESRRVLATAQLTVFVDGVPQDIPANIGVDGGGTPLSQTRTLTGDGTITIDPIASEPVTNDTLGDFFETWRTNAGAGGNNPLATFDSDTLLANDANSSSAVQMFVNGQISREFDSYAMQDGDEIVLVYGPDPVISLNTQAGPIVLELFEAVAPNNVQNFLNYVNDGDYVDSIFHRFQPNFVLQGGSFTTADRSQTFPQDWGQVPTDPPVNGEVNLSNIRGTVAMALSSSPQTGLTDPDSGTSGFFVNVSDNSNSLDANFTVFAQVLGMQTIDEMATFQTVSRGNLPLDNVPLDDNQHVITISSVTGQGDITGTKFADENTNGVQDNGESGVAGARVFIDANDNGVFDADEISTLTLADGSYLLQADPGTHTVRSELTPGRISTTPQGDSYTVTLELGRTVTDRDFGEATIVNTDAIDDSVSGITPGVLQTIDVTANDTVSNSSSGTLTITQVTQGSQNGSVVINGTSLDYTPASNFTGTETFTYTIEDSLGNTDTATVTATTNLGAITGFVYIDANSDGQRDLTETGVPGALITLTGDTNAGANLTRTYMTLADGSYSFTELPAGVYTVTEQQPAGLEDRQDSSDFVGATVGNDVISDLSLASDETLANNNFGESGLSAQYVSIHMFLVRPTTPETELFRDRLAMAEQDAGNVDFAEQVRNGDLGEQSSNTSPTANIDQYQMIENEVLTVPVGTGVLQNDSDPENDALTANLISTTSNGLVQLSADGSFTYTPDADFVGSDSFVYRASDGDLVSANITVTIDVASSNVAPVAVDDSGSNFTTNEDTVLTTVASVLDNDTDADGDTLTANLLSAPATGSVTLNSDGTFTYTPAADTNGDVTFTYEATDGDLNSNAATVTITINPVNDAPVASDDTLASAVDEDAVDANFNLSELLANDTDVEGTQLTLQSFTQPANGTLTENAGVFTYNPNSNFNGADTFTYIVTDGDLDSNAATVTITVNAVNDAPVAGDDTLASAVDEDAVDANFNLSELLANDTDVEGTQLTLQSFTQPANGTLTENAGVFTYNPNSNFNGADTFTYIVTDGDLNSNAATVTINVNAINDAPVAGDDTLASAVDEDAVDANFNLSELLANDIDAEGTQLTLQSFTQPANGTLTENAGVFTYNPNSNFNGADTFTYIVTDGDLDSNAATVTINVNAINDAPVADDEQYSMLPDTTLTETAPGVLDGDTDVEGTTLTVDLGSLNTTGLGGTLNLQTDGSFDYTPAGGFHGIESFTYQATDGALNSADATVTFIVNTPPVANDDAVATNEDTPLAISIQADLINGSGIDTDADLDTLQLASFTQPSNGILTQNAGDLNYTPTGDFNGTDTFTYIVNDGFEDSTAPATVTITVNAVNDAPVAGDDTLASAVDEDAVDANFNLSELLAN